MIEEHCAPKLAQNPQPVAVFAYDFPHRKTQDFLLALAATNLLRPYVIAAPRKLLPSFDSIQYFPIDLVPCQTINTESICNACGFPYFRFDHDNFDEIGEIISRFQIRLGLIAGARILRQEVIEQFQTGIINFHPGRLPATSGLDAFYYSIKKMIPAGVTTHFIDNRVDAGRQICFDELILTQTISPEIVVENLYQLQITAFHRVLRAAKIGALKSINIDRPAKNEPMKSDEKYRILSRFAEWRSEISNNQFEDRWFNAVRTDDIEEVQKLLRIHPASIRRRTKEGWSALIVACFNHSAQVTKYLLSFGANPNEPGVNGTTPLMYAKTKLLNRFDTNYELLDLLLEHGADITRTDAFGKNIFHYVEKADDDRMRNFLRRRLADKAG